MNLTIADVFTKPTIRKAFSGDALGTLIFSTINVLVNRLLDSLAFTQKLNVTQIDILTASTLEKFEYETLEDVIIFFKMARNGTFGSAKKSVDANLLLGDWLVQYFDLKAQEREVFRNKQKGEYMDNSAGVMKAYMNRMSKAERERKAKEEKDYINNITKDFDRQMLEDLITDWSKKPLFAKHLKLLKQKRKDFPWISKDTKIYKELQKKELQRVALAMENNEAFKKTIK